MSIKNQLHDELKAAMREKAADRIACIRQVKAKIGEALNAKNFKGEEDDALYQSVIKSYVGSLKKGIKELEAAGERGEELRAKYQVEIDYLQPFLPTLLGEEDTRALVKGAIEQLGVDDMKQSGRIIGLIMKDHRGQVDPALVRQMIEAELS